MPIPSCPPILPSGSTTGPASPRSSRMLLLHEELARARQRAAEQQGRAARIGTAVRLLRRAEAAAARYRRAAAAV